MFNNRPIFCLFIMVGFLCLMPVLALVSHNTNSRLADKRVLVIDGTHSSHSETRNAMTGKLNQLKNIVGFDMTQVTNPPTNLNNYDVIVFNYWFDNQNPSFAGFHNAFKSWLLAGNKGWVGYHTSGANEENEWNFLRDSVSSMRYILHSVAAQNGTANITSSDAILGEPIMEGLSNSFTGTDEWYEFATTAPTWPDVKVMYFLDESSLGTPLSHPMDPHPMAWYREGDKGNRYFYTPMIHTAAGVTSSQGNDFFPSMILRALEFVAGYDVPEKPGCPDPNYVEYDTTRTVDDPSLCLTPITPAINFVLNKKGLNWIQKGHEIQISLPGSGSFIGRIQNIKGKVVSEFEITGNTLNKISTAGIDAGIYFLQVELPQGTKSGKILLH